jgi:hypothetical protein
MKPIDVCVCGVGSRLVFVWVCVWWCVGGWVCVCGLFIFLLPLGRYIRMVRGFVGADGAKVCIGHRY